MSRSVVIFDIDGTIADCSQRLRFIKGPGPADWDSFFDPDELAKDAPITPMLATLFAMKAHYPVVFCTGRPERTRRATAAWIGSHLPWLKFYTLHMRKDDDRRSSAVVKSDQLSLMRADSKEPFLVFEDRDEDTAMWRRQGVMCCQVAEGSY